MCMSLFAPNDTNHIFLLYLKTNSFTAKINILNCELQNIKTDY